jgi:hypothetical protein
VLHVMIITEVDIGIQAGRPLPGTAEKQRKSLVRTVSHQFDL